ncbi:MAG: hypothetical protein KC910_33815, partial [Candidatus Eremiobacteraeota bacterium]|nr:hypothetical protein [Candidatus Eremiobacteraeota bacterium]
MSTEPEAFAVPEDYPLEQELLAPIPRPVPDTIRQHPERVTRQRRNRISSGIVLALCILGLIFADGPFMQTLGLYFTPFSNWWWLGWI